MKKPDFILIGAPKSGTTSLYHYLQQHPQIYMSALKEPNFFLFDGPKVPAFNGPHDSIRLRESVTDWQRYQALFASTAPGQICGEASVRYLYSEQACQAIAKRLPDCKLLVMLRHPADHAYSAFQRDCMHGTEPCADFRKALADGSRREAEGWYNGAFESRGYYARHLKPYLDTFEKNRLRIYIFDDLVANPRALIQDLFEYLGVDTNVDIDLTRRFNETGVIANPVLRFLWRGTRGVRSHLMPYVPMKWRGSIFNHMATQAMNKSRKQPFDPELRAELTEHFREDILQLQNLIDRDLSHWLNPET